MLLLIYGGFSSFLADRANRAHVAVLSNGYWKSHFSGSRNVIGQSITLNDKDYFVTGVLPARSYLPSNRKGTDQRRQGHGFRVTRAQGDLTEFNRKLLVFAQLRAGVSLQQARAEMDGIAKHIREQNPATNGGYGVNVFPIYVEDVGQELRRNLLRLLSPVRLVL